MDISFDVDDIVKVAGVVVIVVSVVKALVTFGLTAI